MHTLNFQRVGLLLRHRVLLHAASLYRVVLPLVILFLLSLIPLATDDNPGQVTGFLEGWLPAFVLLAGYFITSNAIPEMSSADGRQSYLTLPASNTEKWVTTYLFTGPILFVCLLLFFWVLSLAAVAILDATGLVQVESLQFERGMLSHIAKTYFLVMHPVALLGAMLFDRFAFAKTAAVNLGVVLGLAAVTALAVRVVFYENFTGFFTSIDGAGPNINIGPEQFGPNQLLILLGLFALLLLSASYFRLHEKEV